MRLILEDTIRDEYSEVNRVIVETDKVCFSDIIMMFRGAAIAFGFHEDTVNSGIIEYGYELDGENKDERV